MYRWPVVLSLCLSLAACSTQSEKTPEFEELELELEQEADEPDEDESFRSSPDLPTDLPFETCSCMDYSSTVEDGGECGDTWSDDTTYWWVLTESNCGEVSYPWCESQNGCTYDVAECECVPDDGTGFETRFRWECDEPTVVVEPCVD